MNHSPALLRKREASIGPITLIEGDAVAILRTMRGVADMLLSDPPYKLTAGGGNGKQVMGGKFARTAYNNNGKLMRITDWSDMALPMFDACREDADAYVFANDKNIFKAYREFTASGFKLHNQLVWRKESPTRNRWYMKNLEFILYLWRGRAKTINFPGSTQDLFYPRPRQSIHSTQKPIALLRKLVVNSSQAGGVILDPFSGSGSSLLAAAIEGRLAIGCEIDPDAFDRSAAWLRQVISRFEADGDAALENF